MTVIQVLGPHSAVFTQSGKALNWKDNCILKWFSWLYPVVLSEKVSQLYLGRTGMFVFCITDSLAYELIIKYQKTETTHYCENFCLFWHCLLPKIIVESWVEWLLHYSCVEKLKKQGLFLTWQAIENVCVNVCYSIALRAILVKNVWADSSHFSCSTCWIE